jgi:hypothetical protein
LVKPTETFSVAGPVPNRRRLAMHYMGMDVHSKVTMICLLDENGRQVREREVRGNLGCLVAAMAALKRERGSLKVCYEASCGYGWLHDELVRLGCTVQVAHPGKVRMIFRAKRKNDRIVLVDGRYSFIHTRFAGSGGNARQRSSERHAREMAYLKRKWGPYLDVVQAKGTTRLVVRVSR